MDELPTVSARLRDAINRTTSNARETTEEILRRRSATLASRDFDAVEGEIVGEFVAVRRSDTVFAAPITQVREVRRVAVTGFPGENVRIDGIFQIRGRVLSLVDVVPPGEDVTPLRHGEHTLVCVVGAGDRYVGVRIDDLIGPQIIHRDDLDSQFEAQKLPFVKHVTQHLVHIIDVEALLETPELMLVEGSR